MSGQYHPLITRGYNGSQPASLKPVGSNNQYIYTTQPIAPVDLGANSSEVTFIIGCYGATGSPAEWSLGAKFQFCLPHDDGYQYSRDTWFDLDSANVHGCIVEQCGFAGPGKTAPLDGSFGIIADQATTVGGTALSTNNPVIVQRTIKHFGLRVRVALDLQFTGGTDPGIRVDMGYFRRHG